MTHLKCPILQDPPCFPLAQQKSNRPADWWHRDCGAALVSLPLTSDHHKSALDCSSYTEERPLQLPAHQLSVSINHLTPVKIPVLNISNVTRCSWLVTVLLQPSQKHGWESGLCRSSPTLTTSIVPRHNKKNPDSRPPSDSRQHHCAEHAESLAPQF